LLLGLSRRRWWWTIHRFPRWGSRVHVIRAVILGELRFSGRNWRSRNGNGTGDRWWWFAGFVIAIRVVVSTIRVPRHVPLWRSRWWCARCIHRWSRPGSSLWRWWRNSSVNWWRGSCEGRRCDRCVVCCSASIVTNVTVVCFQGVLVLCTRCNVGVVVALIITLSTLIVRNSWCCRQVGALPAGESGNLRWWWRRRWPWRHKRAATRDWRHSARSLISGCCVWHTFIGAEVRCPLRLRRSIALVRNGRWGCPNWQWRFCSWCLGRELPD